MIKMNPNSVVGMLKQRAEYILAVGFMTIDIRVVVETKALAIEIEIGEIAAKFTAATTESLAKIKQEAIVKIGTQRAIEIATVIIVTLTTGMIVRKGTTKIEGNLQTRERTTDTRTKKTMELL
jgi:hypothetical protein